MMKVKSISISPLLSPSLHKFFCHLLNNFFWGDGIGGMGQILYLSHRIVVIMLSLSLLRIYLIQNSVFEKNDDINTVFLFLLS